MLLGTSQIFLGVAAPKAPAFSLFMSSRVSALVQHHGAGGHYLLPDSVLPSLFDLWFAALHLNAALASSQNCLGV